MRYSAKEWDEVRSAFAMSIMVDTPLHSLAQNLEGPEWPDADRKETPGLFIDLTFAEVHEVLASRGHPMERFDQLVDILKQTLAFDNPFGDMVEQAATSAERDNPVLKNMERLQIPEEFPIEFTFLQADTLEFCRLEKLGTLREFAVFAQGLSRTVIVGGDFRGLLNALSHVDEAGLAKYLPFRPGAKGLHLIESIAQIVREMPADQRAVAIARPAELSPGTRDRVARLVAYFSTQKSDLIRQMSAGTSLTRLLMTIGDPSIEAVVAALLTPHLKSVPTPAAPNATRVAAVKPRKVSLWRRLFSRG